jgi:hypothetical protein
VKNLQRPTGVDQSKSGLLAFTRALRPPPDALVTRVERVLVIVAIAFVAALLVDIVVHGL